MSIEENKAVVGRWFTEFWGKDFNPAVIDEIAAPDIRFEYSLHEPLRGRDAVRSFAGKFRSGLSPGPEHAGNSSCAVAKPNSATAHPPPE
jgi:hypothetical protein